CTLLSNFGSMSMMLFIWCFVSTLAPYPMNSFFVPFFYLSAVLSMKWRLLMQWRIIASAVSLNDLPCSAQKIRSFLSTVGLINAVSRALFCGLHNL
ncbi:MAG: hypothetical protein ACKPCM_17005, partial [Pseudanabaena sp.]